MPDTTTPLGDPVWTPHTLQVFISIACGIEWSKGLTPAYLESVRHLEESNLVRCVEGHGALPTDRGRFFLGMLQRTPAPTMVFSDPREGKGNF